MGQRQIFSIKRKCCLSKIRTRGIPAMTTECLLSATALNLKGMVKTTSFQPYISFKQRLSLKFECLGFLSSGLLLHLTDAPCLRKEFCHKYWDHEGTSSFVNCPSTSSLSRIHFWITSLLSEILSNASCNFCSASFCSP